MKRHFFLFLLTVRIAFCVGNFVPSPSGCAVSHCHPNVDGQMGLAAPLPPNGNVRLVYHDLLPTGSSSSLGASANGTYLGAVYLNSPYIKFYNNLGTILFSSTILDAIAVYCVPMIGTDSVSGATAFIGCDDVQIVRWDVAGNVVWDTCYYSGTAPNCNCAAGGAPPCAAHNYPNSITVMADGSLFVALNGTGAGNKGAMMDFSSSSGALLSGLVYLDAVVNDSYVTNNTPCTPGGQNVYLNTNYTADVTLGREYSLNINAGTITKNWSTNFRGASQSSPTCMADGVYSDGTDSGGQGTIWGFNYADGSVRFHCETAGGSGCPTLPAIAVAAFTPDPIQSGFWTFSSLTTYHGFTRRSTIDGSELQFVDVTGMIPSEACPLGGGSATTTSINPVNRHTILWTSLHATAGCNGGVYVAGIDVMSTGPKLMWAYKVVDHFATQQGVAGQYHIMIAPDNSSYLTFTANLLGGIYYVGAYPAQTTVSGSSTTFGPSTVRN